MDEQKSIKVSLLGKSFPIVTDESQEIIENASARVNSLMQQMREKISSGDEVKKIAFVALQIAIDLEKKQQELSALKQQTIDLVGKLENSLIDCA